MKRLTYSERVEQNKVQKGLAGNGCKFRELDDTVKCLEVIRRPFNNLYLQSERDEEYITSNTENLWKMNIDKNTVPLSDHGEYYLK